MQPSSQSPPPPPPPPAPRTFVSKKLQVRPSALGVLADAAAQTDEQLSPAQPAPSLPDARADAREQVGAGGEQLTPTAKSPTPFDSWGDWDAVCTRTFRAYEIIAFCYIIHELGVSKPNCYHLIM